MAFLGQTFEQDQLPQSTVGEFEPLPAGWYTATITGAEVKETKAGTGNYIAVRYDITGPTHQGRVVFGNINIRNPNPKAEEIGRQQLGEIMRAIGLARVTDSDELIGGSLGIKLAIQPGDGQYGPRNEVKGFKSINGGMAPQASAPMTQQAAPASAGSTPPWARK